MSVTTNPLSLDLSRNQSQEVAWANLYLMLARAFSLPAEMDDQWPQQVRRLLPDLDPALHSPGFALARAWEDALKNREGLSLAYARLFLGPFEILASPYASSYLEPDQRLMGEVSQAVAHEYVEAGLAPGARPHEAPDHVALEWEFVYYLTYQYISTGEERWIEQRNRYLSTHMACWMPSFAQRITQAEQHIFYDAVAVFLKKLFE